VPDFAPSPLILGHAGDDLELAAWTIDAFFPVR
jgi:hypothetical protein